MLNGALDDAASVKSRLKFPEDDLFVCHNSLIAWMNNTFAPSRLQGAVIVGNTLGLQRSGRSGRSQKRHYRRKRRTSLPLSPAVKKSPRLRPVMFGKSTVGDDQLVLLPPFSRTRVCGKDRFGRDLVVASQA